MDQQAPLPTTSNPTLSINNIPLPKLIKDKIQNYQIAKAVNESVDDLHNQFMAMIMDMWTKNMSVKNLKMCCGYDLKNGKKRYCKRYTLRDTMATKIKDIYICSYCLDPKKSYCKKHVQGNLFWAKYNTPKNKHDHYVVTCNECHEWETEEIKSYNESKEIEEKYTIIKEDIIPTE